jgi:hypothetical protein
MSSLWSFVKRVGPPIATGALLFLLFFNPIISLENLLQEFLARGITNLIPGPISGVEAEQTNKYVYKQDIKLIDEAIGEIDLYERPRE